MQEDYNVLLRIAQGDAYCMATEYIKLPRDQEVYDQALKFEHYVKHPTHPLRAGSYTDDTQMSIAIAELLIDGGPYTKEAFADRFVQVFRRDPRRGYSAAFYEVLRKCNTGAELLATVHPHSSKNGAAMRSIPLGFLPTPKQVLKVAETQAKITHDTLQGILSSQIIALYKHFLLYGEESDPSEQMVRLLPAAEHFFIKDWSGRVKDTIAEGGLGVGLNTVWAVLTVIRTCFNDRQILRQIIEWGGDTDTVAALALGLTSTTAHSEGSLPEFFEHGLEPGGQYGVDYLRHLGRALTLKFKQ